MLDTEQRGEVEIMKLIGAHKNRTGLSNFKHAVELYCKFQSIDDGIFIDEDFSDFFEFLSFTFVDDHDFSEWFNGGFYNDQLSPRSVSSIKSSRREFEAKKEASVREGSVREGSQTGDFRKSRAEDMRECHESLTSQPEPQPREQEL
jgi:hypothetical protein